MDTERPRQLHIRSEEAHLLAKELARRTGDTIAGAVTKAIRAELEVIQQKRVRVEANKTRSAASASDMPK